MIAAALRGRVVVALFAPLAMALACGGPVGPIPGRALRGPVHSGPLPDWAFVDDVETIQVEVRPEDPYSVNTWVGEVDGRLYVPTSLVRGPDDPNDRGWASYALEDPHVRVRIEGTVYELRATRVGEPAEIERARRALLEKYDVEPDEHADRAWIFRLDPR